jgi:hypothetical protein
MRFCYWTCYFISLLCLYCSQYHIVLITKFYTILKFDRVLQFFLFQNYFTLSGFFAFLATSISVLISINNYALILLGIVLNLCITLGRVDTLLCCLPIYNTEYFSHLFGFFVYFISIFKVSAYRSYIFY